MMRLPGYDEWKLRGPAEDEIGTEDGETCNRLPEPDEDAPRRLRRCMGMMVEGVCDRCSADGAQKEG